MKKFLSKLLIVTTVTCAVFLVGCGRKQEEQEETYSSSIITDYEWQASSDGSLIVCKTDDTFKYYSSADDLTDYYFEGTYEFCMGEDAITYVTQTLSEYSVTEDELEDYFDRNEEYNKSDFVCLVLNNEKCFIEGENVIESPYITPYYGFCFDEDGTLCLDIVNMNSGNIWCFLAK